MFFMLFMNNLKLKKLIQSTEIIYFKYYLSSFRLYYLRQMLKILLVVGTSGVMAYYVKHRL